MRQVTRAGFLKRSMAAAGGIFATGFGLSESAQADRYSNHNCRSMAYYENRCPEGTTSSCRVLYGPPSCTASYVGIHSPNDLYYNRCHVTCDTGCLTCDPAFAQARAAASNGGYCSCTAVEF